MKKVTISRFRSIFISEERFDKISLESSFYRNCVLVSGTVEKDLKLIAKGRTQVYQTCIISKDKKEKINIIPVIINPKEIHFEKDLKGKRVTIAGQLRTFNELGEDNKKHLEIYVYALDIKVKEDYFYSDINLVFFNGYISKPVVYRKTPRKLTLAEVFIAVNGKNTTSYIPCIAWKENAEYARNMKIGTNILLYGRIQSREYTKNIDIGDNFFIKKKKIAYEISILKGVESLKIVNN